MCGKNSYNSRFKALRWDTFKSIRLDNLHRREWHLALEKKKQCKKKPWDLDLGSSWFEVWVVCVFWGFLFWGVGDGDKPKGILVFFCWKDLKLTPLKVWKKKLAVGVVVLSFCHRENGGFWAPWDGGPRPAVEFPLVGATSNRYPLRWIWGWLQRVPSQGYHHFPNDFGMVPFEGLC